MRKIITLLACLSLCHTAVMAFDDGATYGTARTEINAKAPGDATYLCQTPNGTLSGEQALSALASGLMFVTTTTGAVTSVPVTADVLSLLGAANYAAMTGLPYVVTESDPTAEPALGNPGTTGWVLSSTDAGVRSWVALPGGGVDFTAYDDITWGAAAGGSQTHTYDTGATTDPAVTISDTGWSFNKPVTATEFNVPATASGGQYTIAVEDTDLGTNFLGWGVYGDVTASRIHIPPLADPTAGQVMAFAVPGNQTMGDTTSQPVTVGTWITPLTASDIDDTPSDGNTTQPASSNSVFDGLALKADIGHTVQYSQTPTIADPDTWTMSGNGMYGGQWIGTAAGIGALPAIAAGMNFTAKARGAYAVTLEPNGTEVIWLNGTSCTAGVNIVSSGTTGASAVCSYSAAGEWDCDGYLFACGS